ncbi:MAG: NAD(P)-dependent alcohol dehydrogenase [Desulforegulaceae bacterium]|nr:NAD(P)-dependent alcohol dehydrogenase [Desulforegulaceae bacterium]
MKAFAMLSIGKVGIIEKERPSCGPLDAILRPTKGLLCTSDVHTVHGAIGERENLTLGHEVAGIVEEVGEYVTKFKKGDRVIVGAITPDWGSDAAQSGYPSQSGGPLGGWKFSNIKDGTFAEFAHVNEADANLALIPNNVSDESAVYVTDMMSTGFMGAENANIPIGGTVVVFAQGPVGLMCTAGARLRGAGLIITVESVPKRQELSKHYGADIVIDFTKEDVVKKIYELTNNEGVDSTIDALGSSAIIQQCVEVTKPGGTISNTGYHGSGEFVKIPRVGWGVGMAGKTITTGLCPGGHLRLSRLLRLLELKKIDPTLMTSHTFKFNEIEKAYHIMETKEDGVVKPLIEFDF